ncbi:unnamed protein product [Rotaria socialis]|uniref:Uncharacterized protein n=1 Tax=Rotaria socialis TaxID=392032 RepID=A0A817MRR3_9BILA|nr:unnamed protein product [Rotaria socialis]
MALPTEKQPKKDNDQKNESNRIFECPFKNLQSSLLASSNVSSNVRSELLISSARPFEEVAMGINYDEQSEPYPKPKDSVLSMATKN